MTIIAEAVLYLAATSNLILVLMLLKSTEIANFVIVVLVQNMSVPWIFKVNFL